MNKNLKTVLLALATTAAVAVPLAGYAFAQTTPATATLAQAQNQQQDNDTEQNDDQSPAYKGSIQLPQGKEGAEIPDAQEQAQLQALARITPEQAKQAALAAVPGTVSSVKLGDENGSLVYEVIIGNTEVKVDAGNGKVLHQEAAGADNEQGGENEGSETSETNG